MKQLIAIAGLAVLSSFSQASVLWNNGTENGLSSNTGLETVDRSAGGYYSQLTSPNTLLGATSNMASFLLADDFTVSGSWNLSSIQVFAYQTNETTMTLTGGTLEIREGSFDGTTVATGTYSLGELTNIYRTGSASLSDARHVQAATFDLTGTTLGAGTYWFIFGVSGSGASGPFTPVLTRPGSSAALPGANAQQYSVAGGTYTSVIDSGTGNANELPFIIQGEAVPEPATMAFLGLGALAVLRRKKTS